MNIAPSYAAAVISILAILLPKFGINVGSEELTTTLSTILAVVSGLVIMYRQWAGGRSTAFGSRPSNFRG